MMCVLCRRLGIASPGFTDLSPIGFTDLIPIVTIVLVSWWWLEVRGKTGAYPGMRIDGFVFSRKFPLFEFPLTPSSKVTTARCIRPEFKDHVCHYFSVAVFTVAKKASEVTTACCIRLENKIFIFYISSLIEYRCIRKGAREVVRRIMIGHITSFQKPVFTNHSCP